MKRESGNLDALMKLAATASMAEEIKEFDSIDVAENTIHEKTERRILRENRGKKARRTWVHALTAAAACMLLCVGLFGVVQANQKDINVQWDETSFSYEFPKDWPIDIGFKPMEHRIPDVPEGWIIMNWSAGWRMEGPHGEEVELSVGRKGTIRGGSVRVEEIVLKNNLPAYRVVTGRETWFYLVWKDEYPFHMKFINVTLEQALEIVDSLGPRSGKFYDSYPSLDEVYYPDVPDGWTLSEETAGWQMDGPGSERIRCSQSFLPEYKIENKESLEKIRLKNNVFAYHSYDRVQDEGAICQLVWKDDDNRVYHLTYTQGTTLEIVLQIIDTLGPRS